MKNLDFKFRFTAIHAVKILKCKERKKKKRKFWFMVLVQISAKS